MVRSGTTGMPNSKINLPNINPKSLVALSNLIKPRFGQKSRDATTTAPKTRDLKTRQEEKRNGGQYRHPWQENEVGIESTEGNGEEWSGDGGPPEPSRGEMALEIEEEE